MVGAPKNLRKFASSKPETQYGSSGPSEDGHQLPIESLTGVGAVAEGGDKEYIDIVVTPN